MEEPTARPPTVLSTIPPVPICPSVCPEGSPRDKIRSPSSSLLLINGAGPAATALAPLLSSWPALFSTLRVGSEWTGKEGSGRGGGKGGHGEAPFTAWERLGGQAG